MVDSRRFVLGVDLDGVVADFYAGIRPLAAEWLGVSEESLTQEVSYELGEWDIPEAPGGYEALHRFAVTQRDLFRRLDPIPGAPIALRRLSDRNIRIRIITHRLYIKWFHQEAVEQTVEWLDYYDIPYWDLCFMRNKAAVGADLYVEDAPKNVRELRTDEHDTIVFGNSTNRHLDEPRAESWEEVEEIVATRQRSWREEAEEERKQLSGR